jgi:N-acetylmuramoyl-L-alanine amidase
MAHIGHCARIVPIGPLTVKVATEIQRKMSAKASSPGRRMKRLHAGVAICGLVAVLATLGACDARPPPPVASSAAASSAVISNPVTSSAVPSSAVPGSAVRSTSPSLPSATVPAPARTTPAAKQAAPQSSPAAGNAPLIVIDPGHSVPIHAIDPSTGLDVSDYENEPEMRDVFAVAQLVRAKLVAAGYRVLMTKSSVNTPSSLGDRAHLANLAHAALALSIHDQAGANGGIGFDQGNNIVYYQSVGTYRVTPDGRRIYFTDAAVGRLSKGYAEIFQRQRAAAQGSRISLLGNTGYDLGSRGRPAGDIWLVQLLSRVPWIYNEAGGNSAGMVGLSQADEQRYANGLVAAVRACLPLGG